MTLLATVKQATIASAFDLTLATRREREQAHDHSDAVQEAGWSSAYGLDLPRFPGHFSA
ncbi:MAG: hypothetical protein ABSH51_31905 [Solirubrobacteraceae bacterium]